MPLYKPNTGLTEIVQDTTPQLGGNLDAQDNNITNVANLFIDYIGGNTDADVSFDVNGNFLGTLSVGGEEVALDSAVVHDTGNETIAGVKTFSSDPIIPDEAYGAGWNGSLEPATKNAIYDKIETISSGISAVVDDTSPQLGGDLDTNGFDIVMGAGELIQFSSDLHVGYDSDIGATSLFLGGADSYKYIDAPNGLAFDANTGLDGSGNWEPYFELGADGIVTIQNTSQGDAGSKYLHVNMSDGVKIGGAEATPTEDLHVIGNFQVDDADTETKGYRFRTSGSALDLDASGADLLISNYSAAGFGGTQHSYIRFGAASAFATVAHSWEWKEAGNVFGATRHSIDADGGVVFNETGADADFRVEGDTDDDLLLVDASTDTVQIGKLNINAAFTLPTADGTADQVLTTNGSGTVTWEDAPGAGSGISESLAIAYSVAL